MHLPTRFRKRLLLVACLSLTLALTSVGVAQASGETFGEITRFGAPGTEPGHLTPDTMRSGRVEWAPWHVIGVEPSTNDVFVLEETKEPEEVSGVEEPTRFYRLQELSSTGAAIAHAELTFKSARSEDNEHGTDVIEGIAVNPKTKRLFFLLTNARPGEETPAHEKHPPLAENEAAAAALYSFKTEANGTKLEPAPGATKEGLLVTPKQLEPDSETPGQALLQPHGITVDQKTGEVVILAHVDECENEEPSECAEDDVGGAEDHYVTQRISESGELKERYVDSSNVLKPLNDFLAPQSPVIAGSEASERLLAGNYVPHEGHLSELVAVLDKFPGSSGEPESLLLPNTSGVLGSLGESGEEGENIGGALAISPEGEGKLLYGLTNALNEETGGVRPVAVFERSAETGAPIGWTGGQQPTTSKGKDACVLEPGFESGEHDQIAVGKGGDVFVLVPEYLAEPTAPVFPTHDAIVELGPGGEGCPAASSKGIVVTQGERQIEPGSPVPGGTPVVLSSFIKQGDALSTTWEVEEESSHSTLTETQSTDQNQEPTLTHTFTGAGKYKLTEKVETDNLDTPELTLTRTIEVVETTEAIKVTEQPKDQTAAVGVVAKFSAKATSKPAASIQWLVSKDGGAHFEADKEDKGALGTTLEVTAGKTKNGYEYKAEFTNSARKETLDSTPATLTVTSAPLKVTTQPVSVTVTEGEAAVFTAAASGAPTTQWELSTNGGGSWSAIPGATSTTLTIGATSLGESGYQYRAVFSSEGESATSSAATLTVNAVPPLSPPPPQPGPPSGVLGARAAAPKATITGAAVTVSPTGALSLKVSCVTGATTCEGTITLKTLSPVSARASAAKKVKKKILTLATGSFDIAGGTTQTISLHLSAAALKLLAKSHQLGARATIASHDPANESVTTVSTLTLRAAKKPKHKH